MASVEAEAAAAAIRIRFRYGSAVGSLACSLRRFAIVFVAVLLALSIALEARAADDIAALSVVSQVMSDEYPAGSFGPAKTKLSAALDKCNRGKCSGGTKAQIHIALGMVASQVGHSDEAKASFTSALQADPNAKLPTSGTTPNIRSEWAEVQKTVAPPPPPAPAPAPTPAPTPAAAPDPPPPPAPAAAPATGAKIPGWNNTEAFQLASAGLAADLAGKLDECIAKDKASLEIEEQPRTRLHLASCERRSGKLLDALRDTQKALEDGIQKKDTAVMRAARDRVTDILARIPHVTFVVPPGVTDVQVSFDDRPVPATALSKKFSIDPGKHTAHAEGTQAGIPLSYDEDFTVAEGDLLTVTITLKSQASEYLTPGQLKCMLGAKSQEEVVKCLPQDRKNLLVRMGLDSSIYTDTNAVNVVSPGFNANVSSPTAGWNVGGNFLLDVVTAASPDIVSEASRVFRDRRYAGGLTGGYKYKTVAAQASGNLSIESDYVSAGGGVALTADMRDKLLTPRLAYSYSHDTIGRSNTPFSVFSHTLETHEVEAGLTMVLSAKTLVLVSGTGQFERGDQSKPYRYVPMFDPSIAGRVPVGASVDLVNAARLPLRPIEQLPTERDRYAVGVRLAHRLVGMSSTIRLDQRVYYDTWSLAATTTDGRFIIDLGRRIRVWPHVRLNAQTGASFYQRAYSARLNDDGSISVPLFRTTDRELSPLLTLTGGGGIRVAITAPDAKTQVGVTLQGDAMYTRYFNAIFETQRSAAYATLGIDAEFE